MQSTAYDMGHFSQAPKRQLQESCRLGWYASADLRIHTAIPDARAERNENIRFPNSMHKAMGFDESIHELGKRLDTAVTEQQEIVVIDAPHAQVPPLTTP